MKIFIILPIFTAILFATELKVATYNVDNLFDDVNNGTEYRDYILNTHNWNSVTLTKKLNNITKVICELNADVVGLQEVENQHALELLLHKLQDRGCKYPYSAITHKRGSAIQVALISKKPIKQKRDIIVTNSKADRNILEVSLKTTPKLTIFVNHWRSKRATESKRLRCAKALTKRIKSMPRGSEYIILGDFNSEYNECSKIEPKFNDTKGICGIDTELNTYSNDRIIKLDNKLENREYYHYNLWSEIPAHKRWSHGQFGSKGAIDSIIIPPSLNDATGWFYKRGSFRVFKKRYLFKKSMINRWEYKGGKYTGKGYSDHLPLVATFSNGKPKEKKHESMLDKFWKLFVPEQKEYNPTKNVSNSQLKEVNINALYKFKYLKEPMLLKDVCVVYKRGDIGVIKSDKTSMPITLYKSAEGLKEGICYDFKVLKKKIYFRLSEITDLDIIKKKKEINSDKLIPKFNINNLSSYPIGEIVKDISGSYKDKYIKVNGTKIKLFVKQKRKGLLRKNSKLYIKKAQIGYYKGEKELVVYSLKDIEKLQKKEN